MHRRWFNIETKNKSNFKKHFLKILTYNSFYEEENVFFYLRDYRLKEIILGNEVEEEKEAK